MEASAKTAKARTRLSAPAAHLNEQGLLRGRVLDFGCGRGDLARFLDGPRVCQWDPHHHPAAPRGLFDTVICIYVLNVLPPRQRSRALQAAKEYVRVGGSLYVAVRRDLEKEGLTASGTEQYNVKLRLPSLVHKSRFEIYLWENDVHF
jgi:ATP adenylyltransferase